MPSGQSSETGFSTIMPDSAPTRKATLQFRDSRSLPGPLCRLCRARRPTEFSSVVQFLASHSRRKSQRCRNSQIWHHQLRDVSACDLAKFGTHRRTSQLRQPHLTCRWRSIFGNSSAFFARKSARTGPDASALIFTRVHSPALIKAPLH